MHQVGFLINVVFLFLLISAYDPQDFGFLDPGPQKYADLRIWICSAKCHPKLAKNLLLLSKHKS